MPKDLLERLIDDGPGEESIEAEAPLCVPIGPLGKTLIVRALPMDNWNRFQSMFGMFLVAHLRRLAPLEWPDWSERTKEEAHGDIIQAFVADSKMRKWTYELIRRCVWADPINRPIPWWRPRERAKAKKSGWDWPRKDGWEPPRRQPMSWSYFRRYCTIEQLQKIFVAAYLFNVAAVKKNATFLAAQLLKLRSVGTTISLLKRSVGTPDGSAKPQFPDSPYARRDGSKITTPSPQKQRGR